MNGNTLFIQFLTINFSNWGVYLIDNCIVNLLADAVEGIFSLPFCFQFSYFRHIQSMCSVFVTQTQGRLQGFYFGMKVQCLSIAESLMMSSVSM